MMNERALKYMHRKIFFLLAISVVAFSATSVYAKHGGFDIDGYSIEQGRITAWNVEAQDVTATTAIITWKTLQAAPTWIRYGETMRFGSEYKDDTLKKDHRVILENLKPGTTYLYTVLIQDSKGVHRYHRSMESQLINYFSSPTFTTLTLEQEAEQLQKQLEQSGSTIMFRFYGSKVGIALSYDPLYQDTEQFDFSAPRIPSLNLRGNASRATLSFTTANAMREAYIEYGLDSTYGFWKQVDCTERCTNHSVVLDGLAPGEKVYLRMKMRGQHNDAKTSYWYPQIEGVQMSFVVPFSDQTASIVHSSQDYTAPKITSIGVKKIPGEGRHVTPTYSTSFMPSYYDIPKRVEMTIATDEPSQISVELLHVQTGVYGIGTIAKEEALSSSGFNTVTTLAFEPLLEAHRDYIYAVTARDAAGNEHTTRFFRINARGDIRQEVGTLTVPSTIESIATPLPQTQPLSMVSSPTLQSTPSSFPSQQSTPFVTAPKSATASLIAKKLAGRILLEVQKNGEAWYVHPQTARRHYLGRPHDALRVMREQGVGISNKDLERIARAGESRPGDTSFAKKHAGRIFLQVQENGEAWYINPLDLKRYYLGRPSDALAVMRTLGLGISNSDIENISVL